jgi:hypothetical protein
MSPVAYRDVAAAFGAVLKTARAGAAASPKRSSRSWRTSIGLIPRCWSGAGGSRDSGW